MAGLLQRAGERAKILGCRQHGAGMEQAGHCTALLAEYQRDGIAIDAKGLAIPNVCAAGSIAFHRAILAAAPLARKV
jgi:hypothetical protein